jgi:beta-glucanase (GH16 family)
MKMSFSFINHIYIFILIFILYASCYTNRRDGGYEEPDETYVNTVFFDGFDSGSIDNTEWQVATWIEHGGQTGVERCYVQDGYLNLVFINDSTDGYLSAAIQTRKEYYYGKWEARIKPSNVPGVLNSMYTIDWDNTADPDADDDGTKQEIDIEFLTYTFGAGTGEVHFAVHEAGKESFETNPDIPLAFNPSDAFHIWGFEITPQQIRWFVDNTTLRTCTYSGNPITINAPYQLKFNVWSKEEWINGPPVEDTECIYLIDWVRFTPYGG